MSAKPEIGAPDRRRRLAAMLRPRQIAFVGGGALEPAIAYTRRFDFGGDLHVINPSREQLAGIPCVRSARDLDSPPDLAFVAVPGRTCVDAVRDLAAAGVGAAVVNSSGFAETSEQGAVLQQQLIEAAGDMPFMGPNCPGFANFMDGVACMLDNLGEHPPAPGVAVISMGGAYLADISCSDRSIPLAFIGGIGNQATVSVADLMDVILDDERIKAINVYFETMGDVAQLSQCAVRACDRNVPVVAVKAGRSQSGRRAAQSHTASIAGDASVASALFRRLGFIEAESSAEAMETLKMVCITGSPKGGRLGFATSSGTYAVMGADAAERVGLQLPPASEAAKKKMRPLMEPFLRAGNPVDVATGQFAADESQRRLFDAFLSDDYDLAAQCMSFPAENTWEDESWYRSARIFAEAARGAGLPSVFVSPTFEGLPKRARELLVGLGVAPLQGFSDGMKAIANAVDWGRRKRVMRPREVLLDKPPELTDGAEATVHDEAAAKAILARAGVRIPDGFLLGADDPPPPGTRYPCVVKACIPGLLHKSDVDGIKTGIRSLQEFESARASVIRSVSEAGWRIDALLVEEMIEDSLGELMVGIRHVPAVGQTLTIAAGGLGVELLRDSATLVLPVGRTLLEQTFSSLKLSPLFDGWRGRPRADVRAALDAIESLCEFARIQRDALLELEVNPLMLLAEGRGVVAADALLRTTDNDGTILT